MIECKICGHKVKYRLIEHIQKTHKMSIKEYKIKYGDVVSEEYKLKVSKKAKEKWQEEEYRKKTIKSREWIYSDKKLNERRIRSIKRYYENGGKIWNKGLTKYDDDRLKIIGEKNKHKLSGRTKDNYEYLNNHSILMSSLWKNSKLKEKWTEIQNNEKLKKEWKDKISETITKKIRNNEINTFSSFKCGWYENKKGKWWYSSKLEKNSMILFDKYNIIWDRCDYIIKYEDDKGYNHRYIPDFKILLNNKEIIIEMKGFDWDGLTRIKEIKSSEKYNYKLFYTIEELKKYLKHEINKN